MKYVTRLSTIAALLLMCAAAQAQTPASGDVLTAAGVIIATMPSMGYGKPDGGALVDQGGDPAQARFYERLSVSNANPCTLEQFSLSQFKDKWARTSQTTYDFRKVKRIRYLTKIEDFNSGATTTKDNPAIMGIALGGEKWVCHTAVSLDPARKDNAPTCEDDFAANAVGAENRDAILKALDTLRKTCGLP